MHGVKKTPATEAARRAAEKAREVKRLGFLEARECILAKQQKGEYDEELLELLEPVLKKNADFYSYWNWRRKSIENVEKKREEESDEDHQSRVKKMYDNELMLCQKSLESNPKSYGAWYQRAWAFSRHPQSDLESELKLCAYALTADWRNFHCWDHRRTITRLANISDEKELEFSDKLVSKNPSNYSAWHYRGRLLEKIHSSPDNPRLYSIDDETVASELSRIRNVCVVVAEDQSAWTYSRWICDAACTPKTSHDQLLIAVRRPNNPDVIVAVFSNAVTKAAALELWNNPTADAKPIPMRNTVVESVRSRTWAITSKTSPLKLNDDGIALNTDFISNYAALSKKCKSDAVISEIKQVRELCEELIKDTDSIPWIFTALAQSKLLTEAPSAKLFAEVIEDFSRAKAVDPQRKNLYQEKIDELEFLTGLCDGNPMQKFREFIQTSDNVALAQKIDSVLKYGVLSS